MTQSLIQIGERQIGAGQPAYVIAELSGNHGGRLQTALAFLQAAQQAGADAVKIQVYTPDTITLNCDKPDFRIDADNSWAAHRTLFELYDYAHTPWEWLPTLFEEAKRLGIELFGSVFDPSSVDLLEQLGARAYKIASPEIVDTGLLARVAATGKPVIVSTGVASLSDIDQAVACLRQHGCEQLALLKCTTAYPTPPPEVNLATMAHMAELYQCPVGLSDHTIGIGVAVAAAALGAHLIEKHIKLNDEDNTVDGFFSLTAAECRVMIEEIRRAEAAIGQVSYALAESARLNARGRRSLYVCAPIKTGEPFTEANIRSVRPGYGLAPSMKTEVLGRRAACALNVGDRLSWEVIA